ncbi:hemerythrin superfamily protein [Saccharopolyspora lacisalsi]|uniref:Hemerythrin superfamily protein n=1 Tax=Halosaccharopolyspora lacisalsi TaxID=1000566 RepID=A0A839DZP1_9PSEU|nr:hemerythrin domain-containing protein [Halosaccharopolyspora lacisalsi]MBA8824957.1 hemerythrin superfamily protein [Halosaccharopolyspora lacisalsi]
MTDIEGENIVRILIADHRSVEESFGELEQGVGSPERRRALMDHVITELVCHSVSEEQYLYPAAREKLADGDELADRAIRQHTEVERILQRLEELDVTEREFERLTGRLIDFAREHIADEESTLLPRLSKACTLEELDDLGKKVVMAKGSAPTRPHPSAPDQPPANMVLDPGIGMVDRLRDALSGTNR